MIPQRLSFLLRLRGLERTLLQPLPKLHASYSSHTARKKLTRQALHQRRLDRTGAADPFRLVKYVGARFLVSRLQRNRLGKAGGLQRRPRSYAMR